MKLKRRWLKSKSIKSLATSFRRDFVASLVVTAVIVPQSLGLAVIAGLPPVVGLYSAFLAPIIFGLFAKSRHLVVSVSSVTAVMVATGATLIDRPGGENYLVAVALLGLMTGVILVLVAMFRFGSVANLISKPAMVGFLSGVGVLLVVMLSPALFGMNISPGLTGTIDQTLNFSGSLNTMTLTISVLVIGLIAIFRSSRIPGELLGLIFAGLFVVIFNARDFGVKMVGALPEGLPGFTSVDLELSWVLLLVPPAAALALVVLAQSSTLVKRNASPRGGSANLNRDTLAFGLGNVVSAVTGGFAIGGDSSRSAVAEAAGSKTSWVNVWSGLTVAGILLVGAALFDVLPLAALAAVVCFLGVRLVRVGELRLIWSTSRKEFWVAIIALASTVLFGVMVGIGAAVIVSLLERLVRQNRPRDSILLRDGKLSDQAREQVDAARGLPDTLLVYKFNNSLYFDNMDYFFDRFEAAIQRARQGVDMAVVDASLIEDIDYSAAERLRVFYDELDRRSIELGFVHVSPNLRTRLREFGLVELIGGKHMHPSLGQAIDSYTAKIK